MVNLEVERVNIITANPTDAVIALKKNHRLNPLYKLVFPQLYLA